MWQDLLNLILALVLPGLKVCCPHPFPCSTLKVVGNHVLLKFFLRPDPELLQKATQQHCSLLLYAQHAAVCDAQAFISFPALATRDDGRGGEDGEEGEEGEGG